MKILLSILVSITFTFAKDFYIGIGKGINHGDIGKNLKIIGKNYNTLSFTGKIDLIKAGYYLSHIKDRSIIVEVSRQETKYEFSNLLVADAVIWDIHLIGEKHSYKWLSNYSTFGLSFFKSDVTAKTIFIGMGIKVILYDTEMDLYVDLFRGVFDFGDFEQQEKKVTLSLNYKI